MSGSAHPSKPGVSGQNPDYYAETSSNAGGASSSQQHDGTQPPQYDEHQFYPPPPSGPPPAQGQQPQYQAYHPDQAQYYPPPPPGPPPAGSSAHHGYPADEKPPLNQQAPQQQQQVPYFPPPPSYSGGGLSANAATGENPPPMPPRPNSSQGQPQFAPPPTAAGGAAQSHPPPPSEEQITSKKSSWSKWFYDVSTKAGKPINMLTNKLGSEAFWPTSLDLECDKAARILKSFTVRKDDVEKEKLSASAGPAARPPPSPGHATSPGPSKSGKALVKIPQSVIANAKGLAIFTTFRTGLHISGAGGSGVVMARLPNGEWSAPSGFLVHTLGYGFMIGADIYDCVCVLNTEEAVRAFTRPRVSLGGEVAVAAGPVGAGSSVEGAVGKSAKPVWSYIKSRGLYGGLQADGTVILQRPDANAAFYGRPASVDQILRGELPWPANGKGGQLREVARDAEGKKADINVVRGVDTTTLGDVSPEQVDAQKAGDMKEGVRYN